MVLTKKNDELLKSTAMMPGTPDIPDDVRQKAEEITRYRFRYNNLSDPFVAELFRISSLKKAERLFRGSGFPDPERGPAVNPDHPEPNRIRNINIDRLIQKTLRVGTIPEIYDKAIAAIDNPNASLEEIAGIISKDIAFSAKVLQLVNSSFYSLQRKVETLTRGLALIGTNQLMAVVRGVTAISLFENIPSGLMNMFSFWEHSIACGTAARLLSNHFPSPMDAERYFMAGLFHDIGRLILVQNLPEGYFELIRQAETNETFLSPVETMTFGLDHAHIGSKLALQWNFPGSLADMIKHHHTPEQGNYLLETAIVSLADIVVNALEIGNSGEFFVPRIKPVIFRELRPNEEMLQSLTDELESQLTGIFEIIYGKS